MAKRVEGIHLGRALIALTVPAVELPSQQVVLIGVNVPNIKLRATGPRSRRPSATRRPIRAGTRAREATVPRVAPPAPPEP